MVPMLTQPLMQFAAGCKGSFFGFPTWYEYLTLTTVKVDGQSITCQVTNFAVPGDLVLVGLALIDILLHIAGLAAVVYVIYGGIQYVTSQGKPDDTARAQSSITNALIGLAISIIAIVFVSFLSRSLS